MAMSAKSRSTLYQGFTDLFEDEVAVGELLSFFPARDLEEPATKEFVAAEIAVVRAEMAAMESRLIGAMAAQQRALITWVVGALISFSGLVVAMGFLQRP